MTGVLFKYLLEQHRDAFLRDGTIRIGTLHEYRRVEEYGEVVGDAEEGVSRMVTQFKDLAHHSAHWKQWNEVHPQERPLPRMASVTSVELIAVLAETPAGLVSTTYADDCYLYCASSQYSSSLMTRLGYDACIEILDPESYMREISAVIAEQAEFLGFWPVAYTGRISHHTQRRSLPSPLLKEPSYAYQGEVRALWRPRADI